MILLDREKREMLRQKRKARRAFRAYARNGWQSPWIKKNSLLEALRK